VNEFRIPVQIYYEDTDAGGVVYYANYLRFMERARTEWLRALGFEQDALLRDPGVMFAVTRVEVDYRLPARFNDRLSVVARLRQLGRASLTFEQEVWRESGAQLLVTGVVRVACVDLNRLRPTALPKQIVEKLRDVI
jgi:acyl-CoA thioester hydrolase